MKNSIVFFFVIIISIAWVQNPKSEKFKYTTINQKMCPNQKGFQLVLKAIPNDSRCPEGATCIWAGEVSAVVMVYKDSKLVDEKTLVFSVKNEENNRRWFASYLLEKQKKVKSIDVFPHPNKDREIDFKDYYLKIGFSK
ncbi:MAG TPA: hypothetical protein PLT79_07075 [Flavobacterium sp.]|nr:hypothetical protein [Flavobacterium sp.]